MQRVNPGDLCGGRGVKQEIVYETLTYIWDDCSAMVKCPECGVDLVVDSQNGWEECECGLEYCLSSKVMFRRGIK
jgi:hypothetical protein